MFKKIIWETFDYQSEDQLINHHDQRQEEYCPLLMQVLYFYICPHDYLLIMGSQHQELLDDITQKKRL